MRFSADKHSKYFWQSNPQRPEGSLIKTILDGVEMQHVIEACDEEGFVIRAVTDDDGYIEVNPDAPDEFLTITEHGDVTFEFV